MSGSLDELIQFLLDEIAFTGIHGTKPADVLRFVSQFYQVVGEEVTTPPENHPWQAQTWSGPTIDRAFQEQVWRWLTRHPDVLVGRDRQGNHMSLSTVEAQYLPKPVIVAADVTKDTPSATSLLDPTVQQQGTSLNNSQSLPAKDQSVLRIYVGEERMWPAICGHSKDLSKVFEKEFALLSIIAANKEAGVLQGDLVRKSGQDKRSVPKRTDELRNKGYIEKRAVHLRGVKTSRLILMRFAGNVAKDLIAPAPVPLGSRGDVQDEIPDFNLLVRRLFEILKERQIVTRNDLKEWLEMKSPWRARILARTVRKFEAIGCLKRVKAASEASKKVRYYFSCVKLINEPSQRDLEVFNAGGANLAEGNAVEDLDLDDEDEGRQVVASQPVAADMNQLRELDRVVPQWNPDRSLVNALFDLVHRAGIEGFTNRELRHHIFGAFVRRPVEHLLTRLTTVWFQSQPSHIQHLAIVRDTTLSGTIPLYVQYSFPNFEARVQSGVSFWEAVKGPAIDGEKKGKKKATESTCAPSTSLQLDKFGFPAGYVPSSQYNGARATLGQALLAAKPEDLSRSHRDPRVYQDDLGSFRITYDSIETKTSSVRSPRQTSAVEGPTSSRPRDSSTRRKDLQAPKIGGKPRGRPRKFLQGTEKFWHGQFAMARMPTVSCLGSNARVMSDPAGLSLFAKRPPQFDQTLVWALENAFPVPKKPTDITQEWVNKMLAVKNRSDPGAYITPDGVRFQGCKGNKIVSRILVLRSKHLGQLNLSPKQEAPKARFLTSSAAHTYAYFRKKFLGGVFVDDSDEDASVSSSSLAQLPTPTIGLGVPVSGDQELPQDPVSASASKVRSDQTPGVAQCDVAAQSPGRAQPTRRHKIPRKRRNVEASVPVRTPSAHSIGSPAILDLGNSQASPSSSLPPPLAISSSSRKIRNARQAPSSVAEVGGSVSAVSSQEENEHADQDSATKFHQARSGQPDGIVAAEIHAGISFGFMTQDASVAASRDCNLGVAAKEPLNSRVQEVSGIPSPTLGSVEPSTAARTAVGGSEECSVSQQEQGYFEPGNNSESLSEAFRLVQELTSNQEEQIAQADEGIATVDVADDEREEPSNIGSPKANEQNDLSQLRISDIGIDQEPPRKRNKKDGVGAGSIAVLRRKILLDIIADCGGALPYHPTSLWSPFTAAWQKAGQSGRPDIRTIKAVVKSLCQNGIAKQIKFSHRNKRGAMVTKTILTKQDTAISDEVVLGLQKKMIETDPRPYLPEALNVVAELKRGTENQKTTRQPAMLDQQIVDPLVIPATVLRLQLREALSRARKNHPTPNPETEDVDRGLQARRSGIMYRARLRETKRNYMTEMGPYKKASLELPDVHHPPREPSSNRLTQTGDRLQFHTEKPQLPLTFEIFASSGGSSPEPQARITSSSSREAGFATKRRPVRGTRRARLAPPATVVWKKIGHQPVFPSSLEDVLGDDRTRKKPDFTRLDDPNYRFFEWNVDGVALWEQWSFRLFDTKSTNWIFINHPVGNGFQAAPRPSSKRIFGGFPWYDEAGRERTEERYHEGDQGWTSIEPNDSHSVSQRREKHSVHAPSKRKRSSLEQIAVVKKRRRGKSPLTHPQTIIDSAGKLIDVSHLIGAKYKRSRGIQHLRTMPENLIYKLIVTVVIVRALSGGLEKHINWPLVLCVFQDEDEQFLKDRWRTLSNKHRRDIDQLTEDFQDRFPEAYAKGEVPQINFDEPESADWESTVTWALETLHKPVMQVIPDLPATRSEFDETVNIQIEPPSRPYRDLFGYNQAVTIPIKEAAICTIPFTIPLLASPTNDPGQAPHLPDPTDEITDPELMLAKSWALSTITTPLPTFNALQAQGKLHTLAETDSKSDQIIQLALKSLTSSRAIIKKRDKSVDAKGRGYDLSRIFTDTLDARRAINASMLRQAIRYKTTVLDLAFKQGSTVNFNPITIEDGEMIAILNLTAQAQIKISIGPDVPRNRWGIDPDSRYQTRNIRKEALYFTVLIAHNPHTYVFGNPLLESERERNVPIPVLGTEPRDPIPIWRDIHGGLNRPFWDCAVASVLGIVASRPGASVREVTKTMRPALGAWEMEALLQWCWEVGAVAKTGESEGRESSGAWTGGWEVREWWWMVLQCGRGGGTADEVLEPEAEL